MGNFGDPQQWSLTDAARRTFLATSSLEGPLGAGSDDQPRPRLDRARLAADQALAELSIALRQDGAPDTSRVGTEALAEAVAGVSSAAADLRAERRAELAAGASTITPLSGRTREVSLIAGVLERLEVLIGEFSAGAEELGSAIARGEGSPIGRHSRLAIPR